MVSQRSKIKKLQAVAELRLDQERARMAALTAQEEALKSAFDALPRGGFDLAGTAPLQLEHKADFLWRKHLSNEQRKLQLAVARLRAEREEVRQKATRAFGQTQALSSLVKRLG